MTTITRIGACAEIRFAGATAQQEADIFSAMWEQAVRYGISAEAFTSAGVGAPSTISVVAFKTGSPDKELARLRVFVDWMERHCISKYDGVTILNWEN